MSLSAKCSKMLHILAGQAWTKHCGDEGRPVKGTADRQAWYRGVLKEHFGVGSSTKLKTRQFARAMAAFEIIARNGIYWQLQADSGPIRRARHALNELMRDYELDEPYVQAMARQMFSMRLDNLNPAQLEDVITALKIHFTRHTEAAIDEPF